MPPLAELVDRGYEDAYRQFIEPIVGAGGERIEAVQSEVARGADVASASSSTELGDESTAVRHARQLLMLRS